ncbi:tyrosine-type recombinase/integrase [Saccharopolyspora terrae]|uniref:tyrosine-type recombinase/integrase n=1 Tax=Saccharopolyspora terrae TaxID=2530384 RepID=UPI0022A6EC2A|nr:tyrosine-type recombinase/integrase [Saccharopolyspora terrae]
MAGTISACPRRETDHEDYPPEGRCAAVGYWWRKARRAAKCDDVRLHDLRHFYASGLIAAGCDVVTVQRALGHSSATITLNTYAHLWPSAEDRTRNAAAGLIGEVLRNEPVQVERDDDEPPDGVPAPA